LSIRCSTSRFLKLRQFCTIEADHTEHFIFGIRLRAERRNQSRIAYSNDMAFHASRRQARIGQRFSWGTQGEKRSSMLRNIAKKHVWSFGVTAIPSLWPYYHFKIKSRVLFSEVSGEEAGSVVGDKSAQHRLRRSVCKGWRNPQWHGRLRAFLEMLVGDAPYIDLAVGSAAKKSLKAYRFSSHRPLRLNYRIKSTMQSKKKMIQR
jgi:hypothetical protein